MVRTLMATRRLSVLRGLGMSARGIDPARSCRINASASRPSFEESGFVIVENLLSAEVVAELNKSLEDTLCGIYTTGNPPDKIIPRNGLFCGQERSQFKWPTSKKTVQVVNIWKASKAFASLVLSPTVGKLVAELGGWESGARLANDQIWAKCPGSGPLAFHRDSSYFEFVPQDVITVWVALDDMTDDVGPLEYIRGSHKWEGTAVGGAAGQFFPRESNRFNLVNAAAAAEGLDTAKLEFCKVSVSAGGASIHDGRIWHGSGAKTSGAECGKGAGLQTHWSSARNSCQLRTLLSCLRDFTCTAMPPNGNFLGYRDLTLAFEGYKSNRLPSNRGLRAAADFEEHKQTFVGCSEVSQLDLCLETAAALSQFEPVTFVVSDIALYAEARKALPDHIRVVEVAAPHLVTSRAQGPRYLCGEKGFAVGVDCNSNTPSGLARKFFEIDFTDCLTIKHESRIDLSQIYVDCNDEGLAVVCNQKAREDSHSCAISNNLRDELQRVLQEALGIQRVVWSNFRCRFISGSSVLATVEKKKLFEDYDGQDTRILNVHVIPERFMGFCLANDGVILPSYDDSESSKTLATFTKKFPLRRVVQVKLRDRSSLVDFVLHQPADRTTTHAPERNSLMKFETVTELYQKLNKLKSADEIKKVRSALRRGTKSRKSMARPSATTKVEVGEAKDKCESNDDMKEEPTSELSAGDSVDTSPSEKPETRVGADSPLEEDSDDEEAYRQSFQLAESPTKALKENRTE